MVYPGQHEGKDHSTVARRNKSICFRFKRCTLARFTVQAKYGACIGMDHVVSRPAAT